MARPCACVDVSGPQQPVLCRPHPTSDTNALALGVHSPAAAVACLSHVVGSLPIAIHTRSPPQKTGLASSPKHTNTLPAPTSSPLTDSPPPTPKVSHVEVHLSSLDPSSADATALSQRLAARQPGTDTWRGFSVSSPFLPGVGVTGVTGV